MAAPADKTIEALDGHWALNKSLSDPVDPVLALQGIGWMMRKGIGLAGVTLAVKVYSEAGGDGAQPSGDWRPAPAPTPTVPVVHFDQLITGGVKGTSETRINDGLLRPHSDYLFGQVETQNMFVSHADVLGLSDTYLAGKAEGRGPWLDEGKHQFTRAASPSGWVATQIWGFQRVADERRFARNIVVTKGAERREIRLVYDWPGEA